MGGSAQQPQQTMAGVVAGCRRLDAQEDMFILFVQCTNKGCAVEGPPAIGLALSGTTSSVMSRRNSTSYGILFHYTHHPRRRPFLGAACLPHI